MSLNPGPGFVQAPVPNEPYGYAADRPPTAFGAPVQQTWPQQYGNWAPANEAPPRSYGYSTVPVQPYGQPVAGYPVDPGMAAYGFIPTVATKKQPLLGVVGLALSGVGLVALCIVTFTWGSLLGPLPDDSDLSDQQLAWIVPGLLLSGLLVFAGWVVGIVATAIDRGRGFGVATIVLGILAPFIAVGLMVVGIALNQ